MENEELKLLSRDAVVILTKLCFPFMFDPKTVTLNPRSRTQIGFLDSIYSGLVTVEGRWKPGAGFNYYGPTGDPNVPYNHANKWSVIVSEFKVDAVGNPYQLLRAYQYPGRPVKIPTGSGHGTLIYAQMNDDIFGDNDNHPDDPMRATVEKRTS